MSSSPSDGLRVRRLVKLGGAAITDKSALETLNGAVLDVSAEALAEAVSGEGPEGGTVVVHGAGSFGHHQASEYGVSAGGLSEASVRNGFARTRLSVMKLQLHVIEALLKAGVDAVGISPMGKWTTTNRSLTEVWSADVEEALRWGVVPVLHGDAVFDRALDCTILSGDAVMAHLAKTLRPDIVLFLTNVAGVFDRPPEQTGARLLTRIDVMPGGTWVSEQLVGDLQMTQDKNDTTGGIAKKIEESVSIACAAEVDVLIVEAGTKDAGLAMSMGAEVMSEEGTRRLGRPFRGTLFSYCSSQLSAV